MAESGSSKQIVKAHVKDICYTRIYTTGHFDAPYENYRLDTAVNDQVYGTGVPREQLMPLTCFLFKGYLWTLNNRRLWVLRHALMFSGEGEEVDVVVLPENAMPERKDYVARMPFSKQAALVHPGFNPTFLGDQPKLQKLLLKPIMFRFDAAMRSGYRMLPGGRLLCINAYEASAMFQATGVRLPGNPGAQAPPRPEEEDDKVSLTSVDFPGRQHDYSKGSYVASWSAEKSKSQALAALPALKESAEEEEEEGKVTGKELALVGAKALTPSGDKEKDLREAALKFKAAVAGMRAVLDSLDEAFDKLAA